MAIAAAVVGLVVADAGLAGWSWQLAAVLTGAGIFALAMVAQVRS